MIMSASHVPGDDAELRASGCEAPHDTAHRVPWLARL